MNPASAHDCSHSGGVQILSLWNKHCLIALLLGHGSHGYVVQVAVRMYRSNFMYSQAHPNPHPRRIRPCNSISIAVRSLPMVSFAGPYLMHVRYSIFCVCSSPTN